METHKRQAEKEAIAWLLRLGEADGETWVRFTKWLEADAANADAYASLALVDSEASGLLDAIGPVPLVDAQAEPALSARNRVTRVRSGRYALTLAAAAAAIVAFISFPPVESGVSTVATKPGQHRTIKLADGTRIEMNGGTRLTLDSRHPRSIALLSGQASFTVHHDTAAPFEVVAGDARLRDLGTVFDVLRTNGAVDVAVASGIVLYNPDGEQVRLGAGDALHDPDGPATIVKTRIDPTNVGDWRAGRLVFAGVTLAQVAAAIARSTGVAVEVAPAIASRSFDGVIITRGDRETLFRRLGPLLGVAVTHSGPVVRLMPLARTEG